MDSVDKDGVESVEGVTDSRRKRKRFERGRKGKSIRVLVFESPNSAHPHITHTSTPNKAQTLSFGSLRIPVPPPTSKIPKIPFTSVHSPRPPDLLEHPANRPIVLPTSRPTPIAMQQRNYIPHFVTRNPFPKHPMIHVYIRRKIQLRTSNRKT